MRVGFACWKYMTMIIAKETELVGGRNVLVGMMGVVYVPENSI
jgi:hypothetical protein